MNTELNLHEATEFQEAENLVYIRHMDMVELRAALPPNAVDDIDHPEDIFAVLTADGERIAIVEGRDAAFKAALAHELMPVSVH